MDTLKTYSDKYIQEGLLLLDSAKLTSATCKVVTFDAL